MKKPKAKVEDNSISGWLNAIAEQSERARKAQEERVRGMRKGFKAQVAKLKDYDNDELVDNLVLMSGKRYGWDKDENEIWAKLYRYAKKEALRRMR